MLSQVYPEEYLRGDSKSSQVDYINHCKSTLYQRDIQAYKFWIVTINSYPL